jgi:hypothetical protein
MLEPDYSAMHKEAECLSVRAFDIEETCLDFHGEVYGYAGDDEHMCCMPCGTVYYIVSGIVVRAGSTQGIPWTRVSPKYRGEVRDSP